MAFFQYEHINADCAYNVITDAVDFNKLKVDTLNNIDKIIKRTQEELDKL